MNYGNFTKIEVSAALARGVRQLVLIGPPTQVGNELETLPDKEMDIFTVNENPSLESKLTFVPTLFDSEELAAALDRSTFDKLKSSLFVWLGASYRSVDAALSTLAFIASLPKGSGVLFDYTPERTSLGSVTEKALDALASRVSCAGGVVKYLIQPQAVNAMLRGLGFGQMTEYIDEELSTFESHFVSALI